MSHYQIRETDAIDTRHPVDFIEPIEQQPSREAEALLKIIIWMTKVDIPTHIAARVKTLSVSLGADSSTWADIARECDVTREAVRLMSKDLEEMFGLRSCNARSDATREQCKQSRFEFLGGEDY